MQAPDTIRLTYVQTSACKNEVTGLWFGAFLMGRVGLLPKASMGQ